MDTDVTEMIPHFREPHQFYEFLAHHGFTGKIYKAMADPDLAELPMTVMRILLETHTMPKIFKVKKSEGKSTELRNQGNTAFGHKKYQDTLVCYNLALLYAPKDSRALKLAYSNRSALLHTLHLHTQCLKDIETCFRLGCPPDIEDKLKKRRESVKQYLLMDKLAHLSSTHSYSENFFSFNESRNPQIPCASTNVGAVVDNHIPKIVATKETAAGVVLAIETAFVSVTARHNMKLSCYFCQKIDLNLMPCHNCCYALFCSEECRIRCLSEYHSIECQIIDILELIEPGHFSVPKLAIKAVLKLLHLSSNNWKELIAESQVMGVQRMKNSSVRQIFDVNHRFSLFNTKDEHHFLNGPMYVTSLSCATLIYFLDLIPNIFPASSDEKRSAQRAFARMYMFLRLNGVLNYLHPSLKLLQRDGLKHHDLLNYGLFPFSGKLSYSCNPNSVLVNLNNKLALISAQPISCGEDITVMMIDSFHRTNIKVRLLDMISLHGTLCVCELCTKELPIIPLSVTQKKMLRRIKFDDMKRNLNPQTAPIYFQKMCKALELLNNVQLSNEYREVYELFRNCILYFQDAQCHNESLDNF